MSATPIFVTLCLLASQTFHAVAQCTTGPDMTITQKLRAAQIVLYGVETTEVTCDGDIGFCTRTEIEFEVHCVIKNEPGQTIQPSISIAPNDTCQGTYFPFEAEINRPMVVMVTYDVTSGNYYWDEVEPSEPAYFDFTADFQADMASECWSKAWFVPANAAMGAACPTVIAGSSQTSLTFPESSGANGGSFCCEDMGHGAIVVPDTTCGSVGHRIMDFQPSVTILPEDCQDNRLYTVVMVTDSPSFEQASVQWLAANLPCTGSGNKLQTNGNDVINSVSYASPDLIVASDEVKESVLCDVYVYQHTDVIDFVGEDYANDPCVWCNFNLNKLATEKQLTLYSDVSMVVSRDVLTSWQAYTSAGWSHADACHMTDPDLPTLLGYALCEPPVQPANAAVNHYSHLAVFFGSVIATVICNVYYFI